MSATLCSQNGHLWVESVLELQTPPYQDWLGYCQSQVSTLSAAAETTLNLQQAITPWGNQPLKVGRLYHSPFMELIIIFWVWIHTSSPQDLCQHHIWELKDAGFTSMESCTTLLQTERPNFWQRRHNNRHMITGCSGYHETHHLNLADLKGWNSLLKAWWRHWLWDNFPHYFGVILQDAVHILNHQVLECKTYMSQSQGMNIKLVHFKLRPETHLWNFCFLSSRDSSRLDVLILGIGWEGTLPQKDV